MYCKQCHYDLRSTIETACPECGLVFDPDIPETYYTALVPWWRRNWLVWFALCWNGFGFLIIGPLLIFKGVLSFLGYAELEFLREPIASPSGKAIWMLPAVIATMIGLWFVLRVWRKWKSATW